MKTLLKSTTFLLAFFCMSISHAQSLPLEYTFDDGLGGWTSEVYTGDFEWQWESDGKADRGSEWSNRDAIHSISGEGAAVLDVDYHADTTSNFLGVSISFFSPILNFEGSNVRYLRFFQYYRKNGKSPILKLTLNSGISIIIKLNTTIGQGIETSAFDVQVIDLLKHVNNPTDIVQIEFNFGGGDYFWILDDIGFYEEEPFTSTLPAYVGDTLTALGYEWAADTSVNAWPYVPNEVVVQFAANVSEDERQEIRDTLGAIKIDSCVCNKLELWRMTDDLIVPNSMMPDGGSIGINEKVKGGSTSSKVQGMDVNRYNYNELIDTLNTVINALDSIPTNIPITSDTAHLVAILDTGIDYKHDSLIQYIHRNNEILNSLDNDNDTTNCLIDDPIGWNFVDNNNNPDDNHGHGTHVAGIVVKRLQKNNPNCDFKIIPYKTHDSQGVSNLFDVACATYQAIEDKVDVINDSWGFYGAPSEILSLAIQEAADSNIVIVASAGNDGVYLDTLQSYPVCETVSNLIGVGSYFINDSKINISDFSNYGKDFVDIVAPGEMIPSFLPGNLIDSTKTGTSMASPAVAAAAISALCNGATTIQDVKNCIFDGATNQSSLSNQISGGKVLNWMTNCLKPVAIQETMLNINGKVYPNPSTAQLYLELEDLEAPEQIIIYDLMGRVVHQQAIPKNTTLDNYNISVSHLFKGTYILTLRGNNYIWNAKFIKM